MAVFQTLRLEKPVYSIPFVVQWVNISNIFSSLPGCRNLFHKMLSILTKKLNMDNMASRLFSAINLFLFLQGLDSTVDKRSVFAMDVPSCLMVLNTFR